MQAKEQTKYILVINCGSATLKFELFNKETLTSELEGILERIGLTKSFLVIQGRKYKSKVTLNYPKGVKDHAQATKQCYQGMVTCGIDLKDIDAVGHRIVHGGEEFTKPTLLNKKKIEKIKKYSKFAPLHNPVNLSGIEASIKQLPKVKQIAVFDTSFYKKLPERTKLYAIPYKFYQQYKIRRYGFHGISHAYIADQAAGVLKKPLGRLKLVTCHLGSGCSISAVKNGVAIDTSMGFTPLEGLIMGTRCGDLDPAIVTFLMEHEKLNYNKVYDLLNKKSGLLGISGFTRNVPDLLRSKKGKLALDVFVYRIMKYVGAYYAILNGADNFVMKPFEEEDLKATIKACLNGGIR